MGPIFGQVDLEPYIAPYLLTGLCDENEVAVHIGSAVGVDDGGSLHLSEPIWK